jgi:uncharacterized protein YdeI (YjbR/CyaY-like superfamily)
MTPMNQLLCPTLADWRKWLKQNHRKVDEVWLVFFKKGAGEQTLTYDEALDEALCYGWIDSLIKKIDDTKYARKFTPRNEVSKWSEINKKRVERLFKEGRMTRAGMDVVETAKKNGCWDKPDRPPTVTEIPTELTAVLKKNKVAKANFERLAPSHRARYIMWVGTARRPETRARRAVEAVRLLDNDKKLGLK